MSSKKKLKAKIRSLKRDLLIFGSNNEGEPGQIVRAKWGIKAAEHFGQRPKEMTGEELEKVKKEFLGLAHYCKAFN
jgi:hypothetical protein